MKFFPGRVVAVGLLAVQLALIWVWAPARAGESGAPEPAPAFVRAVPDVPLMAGFAEIEDEAVVFDKPGGRIATAAAASSGAVAAAQVRRFYRETLPQLGWRAEAGVADSYIRGEERLRLGVETRPGLTLLRFELAPLTKTPAGRGGVSLDKTPVPR